MTVDLPWCKLDGAKLAYLPLQKPRPPIFVAANSDEGVQRAARLGDSWLMNPHATVTTLERQLELFHAARAEAGLRPAERLPLGREFACAPTREQAFEEALPYLQSKYETYVAWGRTR